LLLTILGEFVLPHREPVWTGALVAALTQMSVEEKTARQALARTAAEGLLSSERQGRRVRWQLTPAATRLLVEGTERIYSFGREPEPWDGQWLVVTVSVPETQRQLRHRLRTRLTWAGLGSPISGLWVTPDTTKAPEVAAVVDELGVPAFSFAGRFGEIGDLSTLVAASWHLDDVEQFYSRFLEAFATTQANTAHEAFVAQVGLVGTWRRVPFLDPALPTEILPTTWPRQAAVEVFHSRHDRWLEGAQQHWRDLMSVAERSP
jgi:phenylacetic acid degradation operon negative regulatory protein